jgi:Ca-activated chloride channel family protein
MIFENPSALWLLLVLPPLLLGLGLWGWWARKEAATLFPLVLRRLRRKQMEKYILAGVLMVLIIVVIALPKVAFPASAATEKTGEIVLLVDVSGSMAAKRDLDFPSRLERVKPIIYEIIDSMEELGQVRISLCGFTEIARSLVPFVGKEDYPYLRESIKQVLDINSTPGGDTSFGQPILNIADKFSEGKQAKLVIIISDGEPYPGELAAMANERVFIEQAMVKSIEEGIKVITIGVGEPEGARVPLYDGDGVFTGSYASEGQGVDRIFFLREYVLKEIASRTGGEYFFEKNLGGLIKFIEGNLDSINSVDDTTEVKVYRSIAYWFLIAALPIWVVFTRRHLLG